MASLIKPSKCDCGHGGFQHLYKPERWVCDSCNKTCAERPSRIAGICRVCGAAESDTNEFASNKNLCKSPCQQNMQKDYRTTNATKLKQHRDEYFKNLDPKIRWQRVRNSIMRCPESFLRDQLAHIGSHSRNPGKADPKDAARREFNLDIEYIMSLWTSQQGRCSLTGLPMSHKFDDMVAVSIDRIDSSKGHVKGNIQLVCQAINRMKNSHTNEETISFINQLRVQ